MHNIHTYIHTYRSLTTLIDDLHLYKHRFTLENGTPATWTHENFEFIQVQGYKTKHPHSCFCMCLPTWLLLKTVPGFRLAASGGCWAPTTVHLQRPPSPLGYIERRATVCLMHHRFCLFQRLPLRVFISNLLVSWWILTHCIGTVLHFESGSGKKERLGVPACLLMRITISTC